MQQRRRGVVEHLVDKMPSNRLSTLSLSYPHPSWIEIQVQGVLAETLMDPCNNSRECRSKVTFKEIWALNSSQLIKNESPNISHCWATVDHKISRRYLVEMQVLEQALAARALKVFLLQCRLWDNNISNRADHHPPSRINSCTTCSKMSGHPLLTISNTSRWIHSLWTTTVIITRAALPSVTNSNHLTIM